MLETVGVADEEELFRRQIPEALLLEESPLAQPGCSEQEVFALLSALAARNVSTEEEVSFLGGGFYDHYVPAFIDALLSRSEFLTPYTPYQPEVSQGTLQATFEFQSAICALTGMEVANASLYDGPSALVAAAYMAKLERRKGPLLVSEGVHPHALGALQTHARAWGTPLRVIELEAESGRTSTEALGRLLEGDPPVAVLFSQPNFYGVVELAPTLVQMAKRVGNPPLVAVNVDPLTLGVLAPPGAYGADIACGEGQPLGGKLSFGGPSFGFYAAREGLLRRMPGRIAGETVDREGRRGFVLAFQTREQHIRRERATSNICTAQALNALAGLLYLAWLGPQGIKELGALLLARTRFARQTLLAVEGITPLFSGPVFREFALRLAGDLDLVRSYCRRRGVNPGLALARVTGRPRDRGGLLVALTEQRTRGQIETLKALLETALRSTVKAARAGSYVR